MTNQEKSAANLEAEAKKLGIKRSRVAMSGFNIKDKTTEKTAKEENRHNKLADDRLKARVAKKKALAKMQPIDHRKALLAGRFRAVRARVRANTYTNANIAAWTEEYNLICNNPKQWKNITKNGTVPYSPGNKRKKTAKELLDSMNLDDDQPDDD